MNKVDCPQCLGTKKYLNATVKNNKTRRRMKNCTLCDENGKLDSNLAEDFINSKVAIYDRSDD